MNRRQLIAAGASVVGLTAASTTFGQSAPAAAQAALIKLVNFHCPRCRQVNVHTDRIARAAANAGMSFRYAPVAWEGQSLWPDRVYYTVRDQFPGAEGLVRDMFFEGIQQEGLRFEDLPQVLSFLERRQLAKRALAAEPTFSLVQIADQAASDLSLFSEIKAARLLDMVAAEEVPVFVWVVDGDIRSILAPAAAAETPTALVQRVLGRIAEINQGKG